MLVIKRDLNKATLRKKWISLFNKKDVETGLTDISDILVARLYLLCLYPPFLKDLEETQYVQQTKLKNIQLYSRWQVYFDQYENGDDSKLFTDIPIDKAVVRFNPAKKNKDLYSQNPHINEFTAHQLFLSIDLNFSKSRIIEEVRSIIEDHMFEHDQSISSSKKSIEESFKNDLLYWEKRSHKSEKIIIKIDDFDLFDKFIETKSLDKTIEYYDNKIEPDQYEDSNRDSQKPIMRRIHKIILSLEKKDYTFCKENSKPNLQSISNFIKRLDLTTAP